MKSGNHDNLTDHIQIGLIIIDREINTISNWCGKKIQ